MRQIIVNGEDYGEFNEAYLRSFCAGCFVDRIKKIYNQINDIECSDVYKEYVTNATILDFEDSVLPIILYDFISAPHLASFPF